MIDWRARMRKGAPDPDHAERLFDRILESLPGNVLAGIAADSVDIERISWILETACQRAPYLVRLLLQEPDRLIRVSQDPYLDHEKPEEVYGAELSARIYELLGPKAQSVAALENSEFVVPDDICESDESVFARALRSYRGDELVRLGIREFDTDDYSVGRELSRLADACLQAAVTFYYGFYSQKFGEPRLRQSGEIAGFVVIGMGKLGGFELNFASDIDLIYVHDSDDGAAGDITLQEFFSKVAESVTACIEERTELDNVFNVDLRLRPQGRGGAITNSIGALERYYESFGRPWERQAWIKARPCAGHLALGDAVVQTLRPFVYSRARLANVVDDVADLNRRIKKELATSGIESGFDLKNGRGGIRDVEFFVQALQLIHGPNNQNVRAPGTLDALDQLMFAGLINHTEYEELRDAYLYFRHAEHVLQLDSGRQTQRVPAQEAESERFARRMGCDSIQEFEDQRKRHSLSVERIFATLREDDETASPLAIRILEQELAPSDELSLLRELGFESPAGIAEQLASARSRADSPFASTASQQSLRVAAALLDEIVHVPDPVQAMRYVNELVARRGTWSSLWSLFDANRNVLRLTASLFGTSEFLSKSFVAHPELFDGLLQTGHAHPDVSFAELAHELDASLASIEADDEEAFWDLLVDFKQNQWLRIGLADIAREFAAHETCAALSDVAQLLLQRATSFLWRLLENRYGTPRTSGGDGASLAVLALGKLGSRELDYASDLDLVFVYEGDGHCDGRKQVDTASFMTRLCQKLLAGFQTTHVGGRLYEIDTRLRPSGSQGLLVTSFAAWAKYHRGDARFWERQALTKMSPVAGDVGLGQRVHQTAQDYIYASPADSTVTAARVAIEIRDMRDRIHRELARGQDVKAGRGGMIDIEFAAQYLQLVYGAEHDSLRTPSTVGALRAAVEVGALDGDTANELINAYEFLRSVQHRMRIVHDRSVQSLPDNPEELTVLARRLEMTDGEQLVAQFQHWTERAAVAFDEIVVSTH